MAALQYVEVIEPALVKNKIKKTGGVKWNTVKMQKNCAFIYGKRQHTRRHTHAYTHKHTHGLAVGVREGVTERYHAGYGISRRRQKHGKRESIRMEKKEEK